MWEIILNIVLTIVSVALAGFTYYLDIKKRLLENATKQISNAEDTDKKDAEKMAYVVGELKKLVPSVARFIFTDKVIEKLVQKAFDEIEEYAAKQIAKKTN